MMNLIPVTTRPANAPAWSVPGTYLDHRRDVAWYAQYGTPRQAAFYPGLRRQRAACLRRLLAAGLDPRTFPA